MTIGAATAPIRTSSLKASAGSRPLPVAEPADPGRQPLVRNARLGHLDPAAEAGVVGEELEDGPVGRRDVGRIARQGDPAERAPPLAELRPDEGRHEARVGEGVLDAGLLRHGPQVVAVVEDDRSSRLEGEQRPDLGAHRLDGAADVDVGLGRPEGEGVGQGDLGRDVAAEGIVGRRLVGDDVEAFAAAGELRLDLGGVADEGDRQGTAGRRGLASPGERLLDRSGQPVDVADVESSPCPRLVDLDDDRDALVHRHREGLGAAHPAEPGGEDDPAAKRPAEVLAGALGEGLVRALEDALGPDVDPRPGGHLAVHREARPLELAEDLPVRPAADEVRVGDEHPRRPLVWSGTRRPACRSGRAGSRRRPGPAARGRSRRRPPTTGRPGRCPRRRRGRRGPRPPPDRGCS